MAAGPFFVTLEGPDGAGKSSQAALLAERVRATGRDCPVPGMWAFECANIT